MPPKGKNRTVLLIQPPQLLRNGARFQATFPLGLAYVAGFLERFAPDIEVIVLDAVTEGYPNTYPISPRHSALGLFPAEVKARIAAIRPAIVGISCLFTNQHSEALKVAALAKEVDPGILTVMGGSHATAAAAMILEDEAVDLIVRGPGEECFADVVWTYFDGGDFSRIPGLAYRHAESGAVVVKPPAVTQRPLDDLPFPAYHKLPMEKFFTMSEFLPIQPTCKPSLPILTTRGCPYNCTFCYVSYSWGKSINHRSCDNLMQEVRLLRDTYGVRELHVMDDNYGYYRDFSIEFMVRSRQMGVEKIVPFSGATMKALQDEAFMRALRDSGLHYLGIFCESGASETLRRVRKPHNLKMVDTVIRQARAMDFLIYGFFILGFPWQSIADMEHEVDLAGELDLDFRSFSVLCALPGTALYDECRDNGYLAADVSFDDISLYTGNISTPQFSSLDVERIAKTAYIRTNFATPGHVERGAKVFNVTSSEMLARKARAESFLSALPAAQGSQT